MQTIALIIVLQVLVTLLTGCAEFQTKVDEMRIEATDDQLYCTPVTDYGNECAGWMTITETDIPTDEIIEIIN